MLARISTPEDDRKRSDGREAQCGDGILSPDRSDAGPDLETRISQCETGTNGGGAARETRHHRQQGKNRQHSPLRDFPCIGTQGFPEVLFDQILHLFPGAMHPIVKGILRDTKDACSLRGGALL